MKVRAFALLLCFVGLAGLLGSCSSDGTPTGTSSPDSLMLATRDVAVTLRAGSDSVSQSLAISGNETGIAWSATSSAPWLRLSQTSGVTPTMVSATVRSDGLAVGEHTATVTVLAPSVDNSPVFITVRLTVVGQATLAVTPGALSFAGTRGDTELGPLPLTIANSGTGAMAWSASSAEPWIVFAPASGNGNGALAVRVRPGTLAAGTHNGTIVIAAPGASGAPVTVPVTLVLSARSFAVSATANPGNGGTVSGAGTFTEGATATLQATAANGFEFTNWTENGAVVSTSATYAFTVNGARALVANFGVRTVNIVTAANPAIGGSTTGGGTVAQGTSVTVTATPNAGYSFTNWTENGAVVSTSPSYTFTATSNRTLTANFAVVPIANFTIATSSNPTAGGTTTGSGNAAPGQSVTVTATPNPGYTFTNWTEGGAQVSTNASYTFTASANRVLVANFALIPPPNVTITTSSNPPAGGSTSGGGSVAQGTSVTVIATPNPGYSFTNWTENGTPVASTASYTFTANANRTLVANFGANVVISIEYNDPAGGTVSGAGTYPMGATVTLTATPNPGYFFEDWVAESTVISTETTITFTATANRSVLARFYRYTEVITRSNPPEGGTTSGGGLYRGGNNRTATVTATPNPGYGFVKWTQNGIFLSSNPTFTFYVQNLSYTLDAHFAPLSATITTASDPTNGGTTSGGGTFATGAGVTVTATPAPGFVFVRWKESGATVSTAASYSFTASGNRNLIAEFATAVIITTQSDPPAGGTTSGGGTFALGNTVTVTATPNGAYAFVEWRENGVAVSSNRIYSFNATTNRTLTARFTDSVTVTTGSNPAAGGTTTGGGRYLRGVQVTLHASSNPGYAFMYWSVDGGTGPAWGLPDWTIFATNGLFVANFDTVVKVAITNNSQGTATGAGTYPIGSSVTVTATPNEGYGFDKWMEGSNVVSTSASYTFTADRYRYLVPHYIKTHAIIRTRSQPATYGTTSGGGAYPFGTQATVTATPANDRNYLIAWVDSATNATLATSLSYTFNVGTTDRTLIARFGTTDVTITVSKYPELSCLASGGGLFPLNSLVTVVGNGRPGWRFDHWSDAGVGGNNVSTAESYTFTATQNRSLVAMCVPGPNVTITATANPGPGGTVELSRPGRSIGGTYEYNEEVRATARANDGYHFVNWTENGIQVSTDTVYTFAARADRALVANFAPN